MSELRHMRKYSENGGQRGVIADTFCARMITLIVADYLKLITT
jgi:hypothetical protein